MLQKVIIVVLDWLGFSSMNCVLHESNDVTNHME
jgi:hypothetical protein